MTGGAVAVGAGWGEKDPDAGCSDRKRVGTAPVKLSGGVAPRERCCLLSWMKFLPWY